ncbi:eukaryotic rRNA processing protein EBP2-domain-containing protein, partial [Pilaira anomala]
MSRKSDRVARKATKKAKAPKTEKVEVVEEISEEEVPLLEEASEEVEEVEDSDVEENEEVEGENDNEDLEDDDEEEEESVKKSRALRPRINNEEAMIRLTEGFKLKGLPWIETMTITSTEPVVVEDVKDDMARELAFYSQALEAAKLGRELVKKAGVDFSRPEDYFAEMLKSDEHMAKIRQRLLDESASVKASEDAKRQRQLKKFGKKVQVEKQLERQKQKTEMLDKIKLLKRKR